MGKKKHKKKKNSIDYKEMALNAVMEFFVGLLVTIIGLLIEKYIN